MKVSALDLLSAAVGNAALLQPRYSLTLVFLTAAGGRLQPRCSHILRRLTIDGADAEREPVTVEPARADFPTKFDRAWSSIGRPQRKEKKKGETFAALF